MATAFGCFNSSFKVPFLLAGFFFWFELFTQQIGRDVLVGLPGLLEQLAGFGRVVVLAQGE